VLQAPKSLGMQNTIPIALERSSKYVWLFVRCATHRFGTQGGGPGQGVPFPAFAVFSRQAEKRILHYTTRSRIRELR